MIMARKLKPPPNKGAAALPEKVRNKMGFLKKGGKARKKTKKKGPTPTNPSLYARVKAEAKKKFKVYPSAYANAWLVRTYKKRGGGYK
jgi:DNA topoisomerase IA